MKSPPGEMSRTRQLDTAGCGPRALGVFARVRSAAIRLKLYGLHSGSRSQLQGQLWPTSLLSWQLASRSSSSEESSGYPAYCRARIPRKTSPEAAINPSSENCFTGSAFGSCHRPRSLITVVTRRAGFGASGAVEHALSLRSTRSPTSACRSWTVRQRGSAREWPRHAPPV